jgi:transcriptional regulator with XRE-family HTH domain
MSNETGSTTVLGAFVTKLREEGEKRPFTTLEVAKKAGMKPATLRAIETGATKKASADDLDLIADYYKVDIKDLIKMNNKPIKEMSKTHFCRECNKQFFENEITPDLLYIGEEDGEWYCSEDCRVVHGNKQAEEAKIEVPEECAGCGNPIDEMDTPDDGFCSRACKENHDIEESPQPEGDEENASTVEICCECTGSFDRIWPTADFVNNGKPDWFCSLACYTAYQKKSHADESDLIPGCKAE